MYSETKKQKNNMRKSEWINIIDQAFECMEKRNEESLIIRLFDKTMQLTLPSGGIQFAHFVKIIFKRVHDQHAIKVLFRDNNMHELLAFNTHEEKRIVVEFLLLNDIMPTPQEIMEAKSLKNCMSCSTIEHMIHGNTTSEEIFTTTKSSAPGYNIP